MILDILLQAKPAAPGGGFSMIFMMVAMFAIMYFFMIRPQKKKADDQKKFQESIEKGRRVVTHAGMHGKVASLDESNQTMLLEIGDNVRVKMDIAAISMEATLLAYPDQAK